jgi:5-methylthioadenosine/S-adenosylhomocysteine deaminase
MGSILIRGGDVITMDPQRTMHRNAAVLVTGSTIADIGPFEELRRTSPDAEVIGDGSGIVTPGYVNAHQHSTGDRLVHSCIPEAIDSQEAIYQWAVPVHRRHTPDDDELSATLAAVEAVTNGITCTIEAGTVAHPERVVRALTNVGVRGTVGRWGSDTDGLPFAAPASEVLDAASQLIDRFPAGGLVEAWVTLVGHDLMSDTLVADASALAATRGVGLTFHMSPHGGDSSTYLARTGRRPLIHLDALGALGAHVLIAHAVHLDDAEVDVILRTRTAIASCPWAYLRLAQGYVGAARHDEILRRGGRVAMGCDAENAGNAIDILRAATLLVGLARDKATDPFSLTSIDALALATCGGAEAIGKASSIGSLEVGKQADIVIHSTRRPSFTPRSPDPVQQLVWGSDGRSVNDVFIAGKMIVRDGSCVTVDLDALRNEAETRAAFFVRASS